MRFQCAASPIRSSCWSAEVARNEAKSARRDWIWLCRKRFSLVKPAKCAVDEDETRSRGWPDCEPEPGLPGRGVCVMDDGKEYVWGEPPPPVEVISRDVLI